MVEESRGQARAHQLLVQARKRGLPDEPMERLIKSGRLLRHPVETWKRRRLARQLRREQVAPLRMDPERGYCLLPPGSLPEAKRVVEIGQEIFRERRAAQQLPDQPITRPSEYQRDLMGEAEFERYPELVDFAVSAPVVAVAADYLGAVPILQDVRLRWTPVNQARGSSQLFHRDGVDWRQVKIVFNVLDMGPDCGPFSFLPADVSERVSRALGYRRGRLADEDVYAHCSREDLITATGPAGSGMAVDTSRCLHYGGRSRGGERLQLRLHYTAAHSVIIRPSPLRSDKFARPGSLAKLVLRPH